MREYKLRPYLLGCVASLACGFSPAFADTPKEQELEARIVALERMFGTVQTELATTKAENQQLRADIAKVAVQPVLLPAAPSLPATPVDGFRSGATLSK